VLRWVITSDALIPLFHYRSDTKYILAEKWPIPTDADTLPDRHYAHKKFLFAKQTSLLIS